MLINQIAEHIIAGGGKRLRPMLRPARCATRAAIAASTMSCSPRSIEFIHTATLLHDDVVDESDLRRGRKTANALWGNAASVLVGDFLYSRSFQMMVELDDMRVMRILADTTNRIAEGEVLQLLNIHNPDIDEAAYLRVIERKTAVLFAAATRLGGVLGGLPEAQEEALARLRPESRLRVPDRRRRARLRLRCRHARQEHRRRPRRRQGDPAADLRDRARAAGAGRDPRAPSKPAAWIRSTTSSPRFATPARSSARADARRKYADAAKEALSCLPQSAARDALLVLADYALHRDH